jgi:hypothetical protein
MPAPLKIALHFYDTTNVRVPRRKYDPETEDVRSILSDLCGVVDKHGAFVVSGFGEDRWPLDISIDLAVLLEQLPDVLRAVRAGAATEIDFYEQGVERRIEFSPEEDGYRATCISQTKWQPNPAVEWVNREALEGMLVAVQVNIVKLMEAIAPDLAKHNWITEWLDGSVNH